RARSFGEAFKLEMLKDGAQPDCDLAALHDVGRWSGIEIEDNGARTHDVTAERERRVQFDGGEIRNPDEGWKIVAKNVINVALIAVAPDGHGLHPVGSVLGGILFEERQFVDTVGIALEGERMIL